MNIIHILAEYKIILDVNTTRKQSNIKLILEESYPFVPGLHNPPPKWEITKPQSMSTNGSKQ